MAVSGKCYMSLANANRSANRGECVQICRRSYTVTDNETGNQLEIDNKYVMSQKDLKTIRFIDRMMDAGVRVFKIEGRARGPEYVYTYCRFPAGYPFHYQLPYSCDGKSVHTHHGWQSGWH